MVLNFLLLAAFIFFAYWWSIQGFFSALIHLLVVVIAGALALALWEPVANLIFPLMFPWAWAVSLMGLFLVILLVLRLATDNIAKADVKLHPAIDYTGGAICGLLATWLVAGITIVAAGFLPLDPALLGYQPLEVGNDGQLEPMPGGNLWFHVDTGTVSFYSGLSTGAFMTSTPLATYQPDLARQAVLQRMGYDPNSSMSVVPGTVKITAAYQGDTPVNYIDETVRTELEGVAKDKVRLTGNHVVVVKTTWEHEPRGTYDLDQALRIFPPNIRLVSVADDPGSGQPLAELEPPAAYSVESPEKDYPTFTAITDAKTFLFSTSQTTKVNWIFVIPAGRHAQFLLARHTRLALTDVQIPDPNNKKGLDEIARAVGRSTHSAAGDVTTDTAAPTPAADAASGGTPDLRQGMTAGTIARHYDVTDRLPQSVSQNYATSFTLDGNAIVSGDGEVRPSEGGISKATAVERFKFATFQAGVRFQVEREMAQSLMGAARSAAASLAPIYLQSDKGDKYNVVGWVWYKSATQVQTIHFDPENPLPSSRDIPVRDMQNGDYLYLYFAVPKGTKITEFHIGTTTKQSVDIDIPK